MGFCNIYRKYVALFLTLIPFMGFAQCEDDGFIENCAATIGDFTFLKSYTFNVDAGIDEKQASIFGYSYVFSRGSKYILSSCFDGGKMIVSLYDGNRKLITSSYDKRSGKFYGGIRYECASTGVYYITFSFKELQKGCGVSILGFKK